MKPVNLLTTKASLPLARKRAFYGAVIGYVLITAFLLIPGIKPNPEWPKFWTVRPMVMVPLTGATGAIFYHFLDTIGQQKRWPKVLVYVVSLFVFIVGLWLGTILGLDGTLWD